MEMAFIGVMDESSGKVHKASTHIIALHTRGAHDGAHDQKDQRSIIQRGDG